jgi:hypothetical protein
MAERWDAGQTSFAGSGSIVTAAVRQNLTAKYCRSSVGDARRLEGAVPGRPQLEYIKQLFQV